MDTKKAFRFFTLFEYEKEQEYLREMHRSGWKFVRVSGFGIYHFEKCTPEDMIYQIDYNQDGIAHKDEYVKMFGDCGWEYLQDYVGYSYFRKPASEAAGTEAVSYTHLRSGSREPAPEKEEKRLSAPADDGLPDDRPAIRSRC